MRFSAKLRLTVCVTSLCLPWVAAHAQVAKTTDASSTDSEVEEIIVTAQRRSENLQKVPIAITAVTSARLDAAHITGAGDLSTLTPNLSMAQATGTLQPHIRGIGTSATGPGVENPVALYVDGVYVAAGTSSLLTLNNIDRIEVLKGPQGTLFGRNATGGLINVITKDPSYTPGMSFDVGYSNYQTVTADAYVTGGLTDTIAANLAVRYEHQGEGWGRNLFNAQDVNKIDHDFVGQGKIVFEPDGVTKVTLAADYADRLGTRDALHWYPGYPLPFNTSGVGGPFPQGGPFDVNNNVDDVSSLKSGGVSLKITHDFGSVNLQSITAYRAASFDLSLDLDNVPVQILSYRGLWKSEQLSQEFQLSSTGGGPLKWVTGLYLFGSKARQDPLDIVLDNVASPVPFVPFVIRDLNATRARSAALYGQASYEVLKDTTLTLGGRFTYEDKNETGTETVFVGGVNTGTAPLPLPGIPGKIEYKRFNYRIALDHQFTSNVLGYISYNTGFKSGGYNLVNSGNQPYKPEDIKAAEIGIKSQLFDRRLRLNAAAFHYNYKNIQVSQFFNNVTIIVNGAAAEIYGFDLDADLNLGRGLSLTGGAGYTHNKFTDYPLAPYYPGFGGCPPLGGFCNQPATGNHLSQTPTWTYNIGANYRTALGSGTLDANILYSYSSRWYASADNYAFQPAYGLLNGSIKWTAPDGHLSVQLWGKNLTNKVYAVGIFEANTGPTRNMGAPRTYGLTLGTSF